MLNDRDLEIILRESQTIAVVGCSRNPEKDAYQVPKYLKENGYRIIPVNPFATEIFGQKVYKNVSEITEVVNIVEVFRPSSEVLDVVRDAIKVHPKVVWMQIGIKNYEAAKLAETNGVKVVMDRCMMIEHKRLIKEPHVNH